MAEALRRLAPLHGRRDSRRGRRGAGAVERGAPLRWQRGGRAAEGRRHAIAFAEDRAGRRDGVAMIAEGVVLDADPKDLSALHEVERDAPIAVKRHWSQRTSPHDDTVPKNSIARAPR